MYSTACHTVATRNHKHNANTQLQQHQETTKTTQHNTTHHDARHNTAGHNATQNTHTAPYTTLPIITRNYRSRSVLSQYTVSLPVQETYITALSQRPSSPWLMIRAFGLYSTGTPWRRSTSQMFAMQIDI